MTVSLPAPARYFPIESGLYEVAPGLRPLSHDFGNGPVDGQVFQIDSDFSRFRENKRKCRAERLGKYLADSDCSARVSSAVNRFLASQLSAEYPQFFSFRKNGSDKSLFTCRLTGDQIELNPEFELSARPAENQIGYASAFDALCSQVQEDVAVMCLNECGKDWLASIHLCSPSHWAAEEKIGKSLFDIHVPVPGIEKVNRASSSLVEAMVYRGPYTRFVWGFATDRYLNHHPEPPPEKDPIRWAGRAFDPTRESSSFILRVERQTISGLPEVGASVFTIRTYFLDGNEIKKNLKERERLRSALLSMSPESLAYKGLRSSIDQVVAWLDS